MQSFESQVPVDVTTPRIVCETCQRLVPEAGTQIIYSHDGKNVVEKRSCPGCVEQARAALAAQDRPHGYVKPALVGLVGALVGAAVWAAVGIATDHAIGYLAVLVGALTGLGVRFGARPSRSHKLQVLAAVLSVVGLFAAKYFMVAYVAVHEFGVSPLDTTIVSVFFEHLIDLMSPFDVLWIALAVGSAYKVPAPGGAYVPDVS